MKTIYQLQEIANRLRTTTETASISPEDAFGLQADVLEYLADMEQNAEGLGIHGIYNSYDEMVADASAPVGSNGKPLRFGQLVVIYDPSDNTKPETGNIYAWQKGNTGVDAWRLMGNMKGIHDFSMKIDALLHDIETEEKAREEADTAITTRVDGALSALDSSYTEENVTIYGYSDKDVNKPVANADIEPATEEKAGVMSAEDKRKLKAALYKVDETEYFPDYIDTQIRGYDGDGHSVTIEAATEERAGVMSAEDKIRQRTLGERIEAVNDAATAAIEEERTVRKAADDALQEAIDEEVSEREAAVRMLKQELDAEVLGRKSADDTMEAEVRELADEVTQADKELLYRMQGVSDNSNPYTDPFVLVRFAGDVFLEQFNTWLDELHTVTSVADVRKAGFFRVSLYGSFCEVKNIALSWEAMKFQQIVEGNVYIDGQGKVALNDNRYTILQRRYDGSAWSEWQEDAYEIRKTIANDLRTGYSGNDVSLSLYRGQSRLFGNAINAATEERAGVMSAEDKKKLEALALYNAKSVITVAGMDFTHGDILEILKGHRPTRYAVKYETETSSYVCGIVDAYTSRDGRVFTEIYTGGCDLAKDFTGGTHDSGRIYQFMRQYRIFGSGTPAAGTWSAWQSCLSSAAMEELRAMGMDYKVYEGLEDGYIEVKLIGRDGGVVGGSTEIPFASAEKSGFMSREDKKKLDEMEAGANRTIVTQGHGTSENAVMSQAAVTQADAELLLRIQGRSADSVPYYDPFKYVEFRGSGYLTEFNDWLDSLHTTTSEGDSSKAGFFRVSLWGVLCEVKNFVIRWETMIFHQIVEGTISIDSQGRLYNSERFNILQRRYEDGAWSEWQTQDVSGEIREAIADGMRTDYSENSVSLALLHGQSRLFGDVISAATQEKAGVMSAEDKKRLDEMKDIVVFTGATVNDETEMLMLNRVDGETLVLDEVGCSLPGDITKVSQLENDKGYLTGAVEDESITLNND